MTIEQINGWVGLFFAAKKIGEDILKHVQGLAQKTLTHEDNLLVLAQWNDNVRRSAENAGIDPVGG